MTLILRALSISLLLSACAHQNNIVLSNADLAVLAAESKTHYVKEISQDIAVFNHVAIGLGLPLRKYLNNGQIVQGKTILDLGTGSGVLSLVALKGGARTAVATDINPYAVANANYNAERMGLKDKLDVRLVSNENKGAYSVIRQGEKFDVIVSNPPQGAETPKKLYDYSYADPKLEFLISMLEGLDNHLATNGIGVFTLYENGLALAKKICVERGLAIDIVLKTWNRNGKYYLVEIRRK